MSDTHPVVARLLRERYARLSGAERVTMGASMFELARTLALASFPPGLAPEEVRRRLCRRFYGALVERAYPER